MANKRTLSTHSAELFCHPKPLLDTCRFTVLVPTVLYLKNTAFSWISLEVKCQFKLKVLEALEG